MERFLEAEKCSALLGFETQEHERKALRWGFVLSLGVLPLLLWLWRKRIYHPYIRSSQGRHPLTGNERELINMFLPMPLPEDETILFSIKTPDLIPKDQMVITDRRLYYRLHASASPLETRMQTGSIELQALAVHTPEQMLSFEKDRTLKQGTNVLGAFSTFGYTEKLHLFLQALLQACQENPVDQ